MPPKLDPKLRLLTPFDQVLFQTVLTENEVEWMKSL